MPEVAGHHRTPEEHGAGSPWEPPEGASPAHVSISSFWPSELQQGEFLEFRVIQFVVICYGSPGNYCSQITAFPFLQLKWGLKSTYFTELLGLLEIIHIKGLALCLACGTYRIMLAIRRYLDIIGNGSLKDGVSSILLYICIIIHLSY